MAAEPVLQPTNDSTATDGLRKQTDTQGVSMRENEGREMFTRRSQADQGPEAGNLDTVESIIDRDQGIDNPTYSQAIMNESLCGKTISVSYDGNPPVQAKVVDMCPGCSATSIDMSRHLFAAIGAHEDLGRITVDWWFEN
ncbi:hypothetical protein VTN31DRAFT_835 [Thermomyces dupontii]|uniref:uncharacterized protein n=1 Tax=Talaromyces thermophilus TaxID=28565 RepID=UPI003743E508